MLRGTTICANTCHIEEKEQPEGLHDADETAVKEVWTKEVETSPDEEKYDRVVCENEEKDEVLPGKEDGNGCREYDNELKGERHCVSACFAEDTQSKGEDRGVKTIMSCGIQQTPEFDAFLLSLYGKYQDEKVIPDNKKQKVEVKKMRNEVGVNMMKINNETDKVSVEFEEKAIARAREVKQRGIENQQENLRRTRDNEVKTVGEDCILSNQICRKSRLKRYTRCKKDADNHRKKDITDVTSADFHAGTTH